MLIECTIKRPGGTIITMGTTKYAFKPKDPADEESPHLCEVKDNKHATTLLGIKEAYRSAGKVDAAVADELAKKQKEQDEEAAERARLEASMNKDVIVVSDETQVEIAEALDELIAEIAKTSKKEIENADGLTVKQVTSFFEDQTALSGKSKTDIKRFAGGCEIEVDANTAPGRMIKDLLNGLLIKTAPEESELGSEADEEGHAEGLTDTGEEENAGEGEGSNEDDNEGGED